MVYRDDLKIEFKAVPYTRISDWHLLMYRISPDQDLIYYKEYSFLGIKFKLKRKYNTTWQEGWQYLNYPSASHYDYPQSNPILVKRKEFEEWKRCKTMGEFFDRLDKINEKEIKEWEIDRKKYIKEMGIWE